MTRAPAFFVIAGSILAGPIGCGDESDTDAATDTATSGHPCGSRRCAVDTEACVFPAFDTPRCEPALRSDLSGTERCREHGDAYCAGNVERCDEAGQRDVPPGGYRVFCL
ncbi:MAG: hypothetical protein AAGF12_39795 [Myxococcota bacterium]